jgi:hypothetical protein
MSEETKAWWQSRTIIGVIVLILAQALKYLKIDIVNEELTDIVVLAMDAIGATLAIYGRVKARRTLTGTIPGGQFNPNAEVRRAKPVRKKFLGIFLLFIVAQAQATELRYPAHVWHENPIKVREIIDERSFLVRLLVSVKDSLILLPINGEIKGQADF